jgi:peptidoglycan/xylan/chitin deacetylase (PgdA/CDA1 family)
LSESLPVLCYHSIAPGEKIGPERFAQHLAALRSSGLPSLSPADLERACRGFLLTFDDGFSDLWTHGVPLLQAHGMRAAVFAIPGRTGEGPARSQGSEDGLIPAGQAHAEASAGGVPHPRFLRWSELRALEESGLVTVHSHSFSHAMGWVGEEIVGFHLGPAGRSHWSLSQCTGGDERLGIPLYRRGSALAHRLHFDDRGLRDHLADWLESQGGAGYVAERGAAAVAAELGGEARRFREGRPDLGRWESQEDREHRTVEEIVRAREALEGRLGGTRDELCLPWGEYDEVTLSCARRAGVRRVYTLDRGSNPAGRVGFRVKRFEPRARGSRWLRSRLWIYRSSVRARTYAVLSGRGSKGGESG